MTGALPPLGRPGEGSGAPRLRSRWPHEQLFGSPA
jgi:hypothetical protein